MGVFEQKKCVQDVVNYILRCF